MKKKTKRNQEISAPILSEVRAMLTKPAIPALVLALPLASFVPLGVYVISHAIPSVSILWQQIVMSVLVLGGFVFSAKSVYAWGYKAFSHDTAKAIGFAILLEGTILASSFADSIAWLGKCALACLVIINVLSCASCLMRDDKRRK